MQHSEATLPDYEEYEEEITIRAKDLEQYVVHGKRVTRLKQIIDNKSA